MQQTADGEFIGGRKLRELIAIKEALAKRHKLTPVWTERESRMRDALQQQAATARKIAREAEEAEQAAKRATKQADRDRKIAELKTRPVVHVTIENGVHRRGIPIVGDEWKVLPDGTHCVLVSEYNSETSEAKEPLESFKVANRYGGKDRVQIGKVVMSGTEQKLPRLPKLESKMVTIDGDIEEVFLAPSIDVVRELHQKGLNSGAFVATPEGDSKDRFTVYELRKGEPLRTVTTLGRKLVT